MRETREICLMKQHKQHEITDIHVSHLTDFSQIVCSWLNRCLQSEYDAIQYRKGNTYVSCTRGTAYDIEY